MILNFLIQKVRSKLGRMLSGQSVDTLSFDGRKVREEPGRRRRRDRTSGTPAAYIPVCTGMCWYILWNFGSGKPRLGGLTVKETAVLKETV